MTNVSAHPQLESEVATIIVWWLPIGAGAPSRVSRVTSQWWEQIIAKREHRAPKRLVHAALEVHIENERFLIEMAPEWSTYHGSHRGVVKSGPVGNRFLGRSKLFRYEIRCWIDGDLPDRQYAIGGPVAVSQDESAAHNLLESIADVPNLTWGLKPPGTGDMWNSNSLVSWLLTKAGIDAVNLSPPPGTRAPGWAAGITVAQGSATGQ